MLGNVERNKIPAANWMDLIIVVIIGRPEEAGYGQIMGKKSVWSPRVDNDFMVYNQSFSIHWHYTEQTEYCSLILWINKCSWWWNNSVQKTWVYNKHTLSSSIKYLNCKWENFLKRPFVQSCRLVFFNVFQRHLVYRH